MKILLLLFFVILIAGFLIVYSGSLWESKINVPTQIATSSAVSAPSPSIFAPVYPAQHPGGPSNPMQTPADFRGPTTSSTSQIHGPPGPPPGN